MEKKNFLRFVIIATAIFLVTLLVKKDSVLRWVQTGFELRRQRKEIEYYETGQVKMEGAMKDGQREGVWTAYFPDGRPQSIADFKAGKMNGTSKVYWENGNLRWEGFYKEDRRFGKWKYYDEQGNLLNEVDYGE